jgi:hypothetical protein
MYDEDVLFVDALERLAYSLDREARLTRPGRLAARDAVLASLSTQVELRRHAGRHPDIASVDVAAPVFIVGPPRAGGTLLHELLAGHPDVHAPRLWELLSPAGPRDPSRARADPSRPDQCHRLLANAFQSMVFAVRYRVPSYVDWLLRQDLTPAYRYHRLQLQSVRWRSPHGVVVLECPFHLWGLRALIDTYPGARLVFVHRRPSELLPSLCALCAAVRGGGSDAVDREEIGAFWQEQVERALSGMMAARRRYLAGVPVMDVHYRELVADRLGTAARVCEFIGRPLAGPTLDAMRGHVAAARALDELPAQAAEEFGLRGPVIARRFEEYQRAYDL